MPSGCSRVRRTGDPPVHRLDRARGGGPRRQPAALQPAHHAAGPRDVEAPDVVGTRLAARVREADRARGREVVRACRGQAFPYVRQEVDGFKVERSYHNHICTITRTVHPG